MYSGNPHGKPRASTNCHLTRHRIFLTFTFWVLILYVPSIAVRRALIAVSAILVLSSLYLLTTALVLMNALRKEHELKFRHWLRAMAIFITFRFVILVFQSIVNVSSSLNLVSLRRLGIEWLGLLTTCRPFSIGLVLCVSPSDAHHLVSFHHGERFCLVGSVLQLSGTKWHHTPGGYGQIEDVHSFLSKCVSFLFASQSRLCESVRSLRWHEQSAAFATNLQPPSSSAQCCRCAPFDAPLDGKSTVCVADYAADSSQIAPLLTEFVAPKLPADVQQYALSAKSPVFSGQSVDELNAEYFPHDGVQQSAGEQSATALYSRQLNAARERLASLPPKLVTSNSN